MSQPDRYKVLNVRPNASQAEIKQAYRRLVKQFHPDSQTATASHEEIVRLNDAYEVLGDPQRRQKYDRLRNPRVTWRSPTATHPHQNSRDRDSRLQTWTQEVYIPVHRLIASILDSLDAQIDDLAGDPFDDELMHNFQEYLENCRHSLSKAQRIFASQPNPAKAAKSAANLYYCLNHIGDGLDEFNWFTQNYDEHYLHSGQELFRRAYQLATFNF